MSFRKFDTDTWKDPWFENLSSNAKLMFIYLWTNNSCNQAGIYEISNRRIKFEVGFPIDAVCDELKEKVFYDRERSLVWVKNFFRRQCQNAKFAAAAIKAVSNDKELLGVFLKYNQAEIKEYGINIEQYHIDTISIPYAYGIDTICIPSVRETEAEAEAEAEAEIKTSSADLTKNGKNGKQTKDFQPPNGGRHFENKLNSKTVKRINQLCENLKTEAFNPWAFVQSCVNKSIHPSAITHSLEALKNSKKPVRKQWGFLKKIVTVESGNYYEAEHVEQALTFKTEWTANPKVKALLEGIGESIN